MLDYSQLEALLAVDETGTFEGAARQLNLSSFAVVQRIKALEAKMGVTLIERSPTRASEAGRILCDHTREVKALEDDVLEAHRMDSLDPNDGISQIKVALSDEALATWFLEVIGSVGDKGEVPLLDIALTAHKRASELMRTGEVAAALSRHGEKVHGFKTYDLGRITYHAVATPSFFSDFFPDGVTQETIAKAPALRFCGNDDLIHDWMEKALGKVIKAPVYRFPSSQGTLSACLDGRCWAMLPSSQVAEFLEQGVLMELSSTDRINRTLYWHVSGNMVDTLKPITNLLRNLSEG